MNKQYLLKIYSTNQIYKIETDQGYRIGEDVLADDGSVAEWGCILDGEENKRIDVKEGIEIIRSLSEDDKLKIAELKLKAKKLVARCEEKVRARDLPMRILDAELSFDERKLTFYFAADSRVDFRELVSDLVYCFRKLIRLQQIGSRDQARVLGGFGKCGRSLCCSGWLKNLDAVTLDMAETQKLSAIGSAKISGACGKLLCCLAYELEDYQNNRRKEQKNVSNQ